MTIRAGHSGGSAVRWAYGVIVTLCVVLAVLAHHEVSATGVPSMAGMSHAMPAAVHAPHGIPDVPDAAAPSVSGSSTHTPGDGMCAGAGMQHCSAASVGSVHLVAPDHSEIPPPANLPRALLSGPAPGAVVSRAPPDLSVLSQLRI